MATPATGGTEILTEHFGYPPVSLLDDIINSVNILAERALNSVEQGLLNAPPATLGFRQPQQTSKTTNSESSTTTTTTPTPAEAAKNEIESGTHALETLLCATIDKNFDKFEIHVLRNALNIQPINLRNYIRLGHYEGLDFAKALEASDENGDDTESRGNPNIDSVMVLRRKLRESMRLNAMLSEEKAKNDRLLGDLRRLIGVTGVDEQKVKSEPEDVEVGKGDSPFAFLQKKADLADSDAATPLTTTTAFTLSQLQSLRALSSSLRNMTPDLVPAPSDQDADDGGRRSWRRERVEYVEGATRRHLENVHGLELGKDGEVRDGEWQGEGRKLGRGEVEGLEAVVGSLGEGSKQGEMDES